MGPRKMSSHRFEITSLGETSLYFLFLSLLSLFKGFLNSRSIESLHIFLKYIKIKINDFDAYYYTTVDNWQPLKEPET